LLGYVLSGILLLNREFFQFNLNRRIQVSVIVLVILSFVLIGSGTIYYIIWKYSEDQQRSIAGQVNGLWFLVSGLPGSKESLSENWNSEYVASLNQVHQNLNIDFNLYDENGELYYSSQSRIFEQGITSRRMNPHALNELLENGRTQFIHRENIGKLRYIAGYAPFTDLKGNITGFLNLPYFEKQNELNREISGFLSALINIYVILLALSLIVALFISSRITKPLQLIQSKMGQTRLGRRNELIEYKRNDEIGRLVLEYNRMIEELSASAEKLARSERESAWREMARQVAHEIKNPLTPMKLSVQHLQRAWNESQEGKEEMIGRISATLIQQIDTLSQIATEFSDFARMPAAEKINLDLKELIRSETELFRETPGVKITFHEPEFDTRVYADKRQLLRAFSNLLKNAIQAIPEDRPGKIDIRIEREGSDLLVTFEDNGIGIPEDQRDKIFIPNFTTKSSGMGLGLAMVKNILEQHRNRRQAGPADVARLGLAAGLDHVGGVVLPQRVLVVILQLSHLEELAEMLRPGPDRIGRLEYLDHIRHVVERDPVSQVAAADLVQALEDHEIGGRPHPAAPIIARRAVAGVVGRQRRDAVRPVKFGRVFEVLQQVSYALAGRAAGQ